MSTRPRQRRGVQLQTGCFDIAEQLEKRTLLTVTVLDGSSSFDLASGTLTLQMHEFSSIVEVGTGQAESFGYRMDGQSVELPIATTAIRRLVVLGNESGNGIDLSRVTRERFPFLEFVGVNAGDGDDVVAGSELRDEIDGGRGNDEVHGRFGDDLILGDAGDDTLIGDQGDDEIIGGLGDDIQLGAAGRDTLVAHDGIDFVDGQGSLGDSIFILGSNGRDTFDVRTHNRFATIEYTTPTGTHNVSFRRGETMTIQAMDGNDELSIRNMTNSSARLVLGIEAGGGHDQVNVSEQFDGLIAINVDAGDGDDVVVGSMLSDTISTGDGDDLIFAGGGDDLINAGDGEDLVRGNSGNDIIQGGIGNDVIQGDAGHDKIYGGDGDDFIRSGKGNDIVFADAGDDIVNGGMGNDFIDGGMGQDGLSGFKGDDVVVGGMGRDVIIGGADNDVLIGGAQNDIAIGGSGADFVRGNGGANDILLGGSGGPTGLPDLGDFVDGSLEEIHEDFEFFAGWINDT